MTGEFINVDVEILSAKPLGGLKREFEALGAFYLYCGRVPSGYLLILEMNTFLVAKLERRLVSVCRLVERLSPEGRKIWDAAKGRSFDIGIKAVDEHQAARFSVPAKLVQRIADLGGTLTVTVYAPETYPP